MYLLNILNMLHILLFFFPRCRLFHNVIFFGSCNIHILNRGWAKILKKIPAPKGLKTQFVPRSKHFSSRL